MTARAFAPAKINLALHVTGRRADGYHLLDSIVVFADVGDTVTASPAAEWSLTMDGPFAAGLDTSGDNLVLRAARVMGGAPAALHLDKRLPLASGIGGGSGDAAATLCVLGALDGRALPNDAAAALGADVPVCLAGRPARMRGIGERLDPLPELPQAALCLVNPGIAVPTPAVFSALDRRDGTPLPDLRAWRDADDLAAWLGTCRNDLEPPALGIAPQIGAALAALRATPRCRIARMSGSGATCFALYPTRPEAEQAAAAIRRDRPDWWVVAANMLR